jgi:hypothetical protein
MLSFLISLGTKKVVEKNKNQCYKDAVKHEAISVATPLENT